MLISCPKCHSIYDIPDDLIGRTGKNFRCQACSNVWHALPEDAIGYIKETEDNTPYIEAIPVTEPPHRHFPLTKRITRCHLIPSPVRALVLQKRLLNKRQTNHQKNPRKNKKKSRLLQMKALRLPSMPCPRQMK